MKKRITFIFREMSSDADFFSAAQSRVTNSKAFNNPMVRTIILGKRKRIVAKNRLKKSRNTVCVTLDNYQSVVKNRFIDTNPTIIVQDRIFFTQRLLNFIYFVQSRLVVSPAEVRLLLGDTVTTNAFKDVEDHMRQNDETKKHKQRIKKEAESRRKNIMPSVYKEKPWIVVDMDDTLVNLRNPMVAVLNKHFGKKLSVSDLVGYGLDSLYEASFSNIINAWNHEKLLEKAYPDTSTIADSMKRLREKYNVHIITCRGWYPDSFHFTLNQLRDFHIGFDNLTVLPITGNKSTVVNGKNYEYMIEDATHQLSRFIPEYFLIKRPWNINSGVGVPSNYVDNFDQAVERILSEG